MSIILLSSLLTIIIFLVSTNSRHFCWLEYNKRLFANQKEMEETRPTDPLLYPNAEVSASANINWSKLDAKEIHDEMKAIDKLFKNDIIIKGI